MHLRLYEGLAGLAVIEFPTFTIVSVKDRGEFNIVPFSRPEIMAPGERRPPPHTDDVETSDLPPGKRRKVYTEEQLENSTDSEDSDGSEDVDEGKEVAGNAEETNDQEKEEVDEEVDEGADEEDKEDDEEEEEEEEEEEKKEPTTGDQAN